MQLIKNSLKIPPKAFWLCILKILRQGNYLVRIKGLKFSWAHVISLVTSGMTKTNAIGSKVGWINGRETFMWSPKWRGKYQESYTAVVHAIKSEWIFLQYVTKYTGKEFSGLEKVLLENLLPHILFGRSKTLPTIVEALNMLPVNKYGLSLQNPVTSSEYKYTSSLRASYELIGSFTGERDFSTADHPCEVK